MKPRTWNVTGLYKAQKDRPPAQRSRRKPATVVNPIPFRLVAGTASPRCQACSKFLRLADFEAGEDRCEDCR